MLHLGFTHKAGVSSPIRTLQGAGTRGVGPGQPASVASSWAPGYVRVDNSAGSMCDSRQPDVWDSENTTPLS